MHKDSVSPKNRDKNTDFCNVDIFSVNNIGQQAPPTVLVDQFRICTHVADILNMHEGFCC